MLMNRRFGAEIELNTTTNILKSKHEVPDGAELVGSLIHKTTGDSVEFHAWEHTNNNTKWIIKPDGSCGMEVCTPIMKGTFDLMKLVKVVEAFKNNGMIQSDRRCSFHIHINVENFNFYQIGSILAWWIKCEPIFYDFLPDYRKCSRHTQMVGITNMFQSDRHYEAEYIIERLGSSKYYSVNVYHMRQKRRKTIEFRIAENAACLDPLFVKNWIQLLLYFVQTFYCKKIPMNLNWLEPSQILSMMPFNDPRLQSTKSWFIDRLIKNSGSCSTGICQKSLRLKAIEEITKINENVAPLNGDLQSLLYSRENNF